MSDEQSSTATAAMAGGGTALQLLATQRCGEADRALQLSAMARPAERYNSLLWRGRQSVAARCCGEADSELQLAAATMASSTATCGDGRQRATALANAVQRSPLCWLAGM